ncbi:hypothetical protein [Vreelandella jeotgali]|uniref:hypothetical protein n=1 Tax=Vreelandella jeotgali TaxID=553386 RepID=UPI0003488876|nr:hypothetical protein [Halomonas jeotgali]
MKGTAVGPRLKQKLGTLMALLRHGDWGGIGERLRRYMARLGIPLASPQQRRLAACRAGVDILCSPQCTTAARRLGVVLEQLGMAPVRVVADGSGTGSKRLCWVLCPEAFARLPACYIAWPSAPSADDTNVDTQTPEQAPAHAYDARLPGAVVVISHTQAGLREIQEDAGLGHGQLYWVPLEPGTASADVAAPTPVAFYVARMLVALDVLPPEVLEAPEVKSLPFAPAALEQGVGLSLPETWQRQAAFKASFPGYPVFPGLRHHQGWRGCALSYRYLARRALEADLARLEVREDDALLDAAAAKRWAQASALFDASDDYDILSGLIADVAEHMTVLDAFSRDGEDYLVIDCMTSTVCNRYGHRAIRLLAEWPFADADDSNTVDRYLERQQIRVLVPLPFIATHRPDGHSTLWHFQNTTYDDMIANSEQTLCQAFARTALRD